MAHTRLDQNRREFLTSAAALVAGAATLRARAGQTGRRPSVPDADVDALFDRSIVIDALSADERWQEPDPIFAAYKRSGLTAIHTSLANSSFAVAQRDLAAWQQRFTQWPDRFFKMTRGRDVAEAKKTGRVAVLLGFQDGRIVDDSVANLDALYAAGTRCIQLTYNARNRLGDGCTEPENHGLTDFGAAVVARMNELGIIVDLSHCGEATSADGIARSKRPPAFTHTMCRALYDHIRAKSDVLLKAMSDKGGMTGILTLGYFVGPKPETSVEDYLNHIDHAVKVAGIDHVGLASDYSIRGIESMNTRENWYVPRLSSFPPEYRVRWPPWVKELDPPDRYRTITHGLARRGYSTAEIEKLIGGNWLRYFTEILG